MLEVLLIGGSAGLGAVVRYLLSKLNGALKASKFPLGTYLVNIVGSLLIGILFVHFGKIDPIYKIFATGFCGGLTTFSTFNFELFDLLDHHDYKLFVEYFLTSYGLGFVAVVLGMLIGQAF